MVDSALADNVVVVFFAYIAAFLPWTVVAGTDFVNPKWRAIKIIRRDAIHNLIFSLLPAGYIIFYIYLQAASGDFKEMLAAVVALMFSFLHAARTMAAIIQLHFFRRWALDSIAFLRAVGIDYRPHMQTHDSNDKPRSDSDIVDNLLVNEEVIDNQLLHGPSHLSIEYSHLSLRLPTASHEVGFFRERIFLVLKVCFVPFLFLLNLSKYLVYKHPLPKMHFHPHRPNEIWLHWTVALVSQGLQHWLLTLSVPDIPDRDPDLENCSPLVRYRRRREYFVGQVLSAASLQFWPRLLSSAADVPSPVLWPVWPVSSGIASDVPSKVDFLFHAMSDARIFPFLAAHTSQSRSTDIDRLQAAWRGYRPFQSRLERIVESLPSGFGDPSRFDSSALEWFTILLHLGACIVSAKKDFPLQLSPFPLQRSSSFVRVSRTEGPLDHDVAFRNLSMQLGFVDRDLGDSGREDLIVPNEILGNAVLPFGQEGFEMLAEKNMLTWGISELVDIWLSMTAGFQIEEMCGSRSSLLLNQKMVPVNDVDSSGMAKYDLRTAEGQRMMERDRLDRQYDKKRHVYWHLDQTLTFMGFSMEYVRSRLASWVKVSGRQGKLKEVWRPCPKLYDDDGILCTGRSSIGRLSDELAAALFKFGRELLLRRSVQVRLIWEVLESLKIKTIARNSPECLEIMMMCMLSFPGISVKLIDEDIMVGNKSEDIEQQDVGPNGVTGNTQEEFVLIAEPVGSPQPFLLQIQVSLMHAGVSEVSARIIKVGENSEDDEFDWGLWRDTFHARLQALGEWQKEHDNPSVGVRATEDDISKGMEVHERYYLGHLDSFDFWVGWQPFRDLMCLFELENSGFCREFSNTADVTTALLRKQTGSTLVLGSPSLGNKVQKTTSIPRAQLGKACVVIAEILTERNKGPKFNVSAGSTEEISEVAIREANKLMSQSNGKNNTERALLLLESSVVELGSAAAVVEIVNLLTQEGDERHVELALETVDEHLDVFGKGMKTIRNESIGSVMKRLMCLYEERMLKRGYDKRSVYLYCNFAGWMMWLGPAENFKLALAKTRCVFLRSRQVDALRVLAVSKEIQRLRAINSSSEQRQLDLLWEGYLTRGVTQESMMPSASDSLSWFEGFVGIERSPKSPARR